MKRQRGTQEESQRAEAPLSPVLTIEETAALFRTTVKTVRNAVRNGELETFKLGRTTYILREPLEDRLKARIPLGVPASEAPARRRHPVPKVRRTNM